jgi:DUF1680 family protein
VQSQYLQTDDGIALALFGPSILRFTHQGHPVVLEQVTDFPDSLSLRLVMHIAPRASFSIALRKPVWANGLRVELPHNNLTWDAQLTSVQGTWSDGDTVEVHFDAQLQTKRSRQSEVYFQRGPLVYAQPIDAHTRTTRLWPQEVFREIEVLPVNPRDQWLELPHDFAARVIDDGKTISVPLVNGDGEEQACTLVPMKDTVLRRVTFKVRSTPPKTAQ